MFGVAEHLGPGAGIDAAWSTVNAPAAEPPSAQLDAARDQLEADGAALEALRAQAAEANQRAAEAIARIADGATTDEVADNQQALGIGGSSSLSVEG